MRKFVLVASMVAVSTLGAMAPAQAGPTDPRDNVGYCVSDDFYGNQPNRDAEGNVVPSQSPGPTKTLPDGTVVQGNSIGDYNSGRATGGQRVNIPQLCRAAVG
ncbi:MAG: hypothetical protein ACTHKG_02245 [Nocardioides sp.]